MAGLRVSVMTWNVWGHPGTHLMPQRLSSINCLIAKTYPDIILLQEINAEILASILQSFGEVYSHVPPGDDISWSNESNILWRTDLFTPIEYGKFPLDIPDLPDRALFWVKLASTCATESFPPIMLSTAHMPWAGCHTEVTSGINIRIDITRKICNFFSQIKGIKHIPLIFTGDFNEDFHPLRVLREEMGMIDVFESLDLPAPVTHPVRPCDICEEIRPDRTLDWITHLLPVGCRVIAAYVKSVRGGYPPPSDHMPVVAVFELFCK